jgi:hypothetical protein
MRLPLVVPRLVNKQGEEILEAERSVGSEPAVCEQRRRGGRHLDVDYVCGVAAKAERNVRAKPNAVDRIDEPVVERL